MSKPPQLQLENPPQKPTQPEPASPAADSPTRPGLNADTIQQLPRALVAPAGQPPVPRGPQGDSPTQRAGYDQTMAYAPAQPAAAPGGEKSSGSLGFSVGPPDSDRVPHSPPHLATQGFQSPLAHAEPEEQIGPYEILGELGRGGMGVVYKARHKQLGRVVAIKMILAGAPGDHERIDRFLLEAQAIAKLQHPGIVQIYEIGQHEGLPYFALEFVEGAALDTRIAKQPLEAYEAARITADLAATVAFAHAAGVLHRDIKPANVLMAAEGKPKLTDFGLAKRISDQPSDMQTQDGTIMGTPSYMPPEQASGDMAAIGPAADQYALGAVLYHLLTGRPPFMSARPIEIVMQVLHQEPVAPRQLQPTIPIDLETICLKALSKEQARRYASCDELAADLGRFLRREPIVARPVSPAERLWRWCRRNPRIAIPVATAAASLLLALGVSLWAAYRLSAINIALDAQTQAALSAKQKADDNAQAAKDNAAQAKLNATRAEDNARQADNNARLAYRRAVDAKNSVAQMLLAIRGSIPTTEDKLRPVRSQLMKVAAEQLEKLPDSAADYDLSTGLEKARLLELQYTTALELGEPSKALAHLEQAERITRERNDAQHTDATRFNLMTVLLYHAQARQSVRRDMELARRMGNESVRLLEDVLAHPNPAEFDADKGSIQRLDTLTQTLVASYQYARTLRKLGRVNEALTELDKGIARFDEAMEVLRAGPPFKDLPAEQWEQQKRVFRGMLAEQDQLRVLLLLSCGRGEEARAEQTRLLQSAREALEHDGSPGKFASREKLVACLYFAGDVASASGDVQQALALYREAVDAARALYDENPALEIRRNDLNICLVRLAGVLRDKSPEQAQLLYGEALKIARDMVSADDQGVMKHVAVALALPFTGEHAEGARLAESILARVERADAELQIDMARAYAGCALAARQANGDLAGTYVARAIELLSAAIDNGYKDRVYLANHVDYAPLRENPAFQDVLARISAAAAAPRESD